MGDNLIGYARGSTGDQNPDLQHDALTAAGCTRMFSDLGAQAFRDQLRAVGLPDERVHFELFDAGHRGIDYRYPLTLAWLYRQIAEGSS